MIIYVCAGSFLCRETYMSLCLWMIIGRHVCMYAYMNSHT